jgi:hypothetical protein
LALASTLSGGNHRAGSSAPLLTRSVPKGSVRLSATGLGDVLAVFVQYVSLAHRHLQLGEEWRSNEDVGG